MPVSRRSNMSPSLYRGQLLCTCHQPVTKAQTPLTTKPWLEMGFSFLQDPKKYVVFQNCGFPGGFPSNPTNREFQKLQNHQDPKAHRTPTPSKETWAGAELVARGPVDGQRLGPTHVTNRSLKRAKEPEAVSAGGRSPHVWGGPQRKKETGLPAKSVR